MSGYDQLIWRSPAVDQVVQLRNSMFDQRTKTCIGIKECAGRTLAQEIVAEADHPSVSRATMDGYAVDSKADPPLQVVGEVFPEKQPPDIGRNETVKITTGAQLPDGADSVVKKEIATVDNGHVLFPDVSEGTYVYQRGTNVTQGEILFEKGEQIHSRDTLLLNDIGYTEVPIFDQLSTGILATGTEIHTGKQKDLDSPMLVNLIQSWGHNPTYEGSVPDSREEIKDQILELSKKHDVLMTTGGTSVGKKDYVIKTLNDLGEILFHKVRVRPGKPIAVATVDDCVVFAIPGKPIGAYIITSLIAQPFFTGTCGWTTREMTIPVDIELSASGFEYAIPVVFTENEAYPLGHTSSELPIYDTVFNPSVLSSSTRAARADGLFFTKNEFTAGDTAEIVVLP